MKRHSAKKSIWIMNVDYVEQFETLNPKSSFQVELNELSDRKIEVCFIQKHLNCN